MPKHTRDGCTIGRANLLLHRYCLHVAELDAVDSADVGKKNTCCIYK
ncbi:MAG: hypothetical protein HOI53_09735 [Francisellaceae bacterium]|nr:hypothetical protein [Francisellaceae bacterium]MBT6208295.1 hypothetical protein [Francisellaceae bacterium]MBT6538652.1 hypothetical protein [Francisellaceae bacterium]